MRADDPTEKIEQLLRSLGIAFFAIVLALLFWVFWRGPAILARDDNPRQVERELRIQRGTIFDRDGRVLAETTGPPNALARRYLQSGSSPAVGYYSFRHGTSGIEESYNAYLRGDNGDLAGQMRRELLHEPQTGADLQLTLDAHIQAQTDAVLGQRAGAALLLALNPAENGEDATWDILALVSHPVYDPNRLNEQFETLIADADAPLLNRVTQGQYQPGLVLQPFLLAAALAQNALTLDEVVRHANRPVIINEVATYCATTPPEPATWADVLAHRCPGPMFDLADRLSLPLLEAIFTDFALNEPPRSPLKTNDVPYNVAEDGPLALLGQDTLVVTPLQIALAWAALGNDGRFAPLRLVMAEQDETGAWRSMEGVEVEEMATAVDPISAAQIRQVLSTQREFVEFSALVLSGPDGSTNAWYLGLAPADDPAYALVVVVEDSDNLAEVVGVGRAVLTAVTRQEQ
jgi:penicillin-binding protein A